MTHIKDAVPKQPAETYKMAKQFSQLLSNAVKKLKTIKAEQPLRSHLYLIINDTINLLSAFAKQTPNTAGIINSLHAFKYSLTPPNKKLTANEIEQRLNQFENIIQVKFVNNPLIKNLTIEERIILSEITQTIEAQIAEIRNIHTPKSYYLPCEATIIDTLQTWVIDLYRNKNHDENFYHKFTSEFNQQGEFIAKTIYLLQQAGFTSETIAIIKELPIAHFFTAHFMLKTAQEEFYLRYPTAAHKKEFLKENLQRMTTINVELENALRPNYDDGLTPQRMFAYALYLYTGGNFLSTKNAEARFKEIQEAFKIFYGLHQTGYAPATFWVADIIQHHGLLDNKSDLIAIQQQIIDSKGLMNQSHVSTTKDNTIKNQFAVKIIIHQLQQLLTIRRNLEKEKVIDKNIVGLFLDHEAEFKKLLNDLQAALVTPDLDQTKINELQERFDVLTRQFFPENNPAIFGGSGKDGAAHPALQLLQAYQASLISSDDQIKDLLRKKIDTKPHYIIIGEQTKNLGVMLFGSAGGALSALGGAMLGTLIFPGVGTIIGGLLGAIGGSLVLGYLGGKLLPPLGRWIAARFEFYQGANALYVKRIGVMTAGIGIVIGGLLGTFLIPIPGIGTFVGSAIGAVVTGTLGAASAYIASKYFNARTNTMILGAIGAAMGVGVGALLGSILFPGIGTIAGAALGALVGGTVTAFATWASNKYRSPLREIDIQKDVATGLAVASGATIGGLIGTYFVPAVSLIPIIGHSTALSAPFIGSMVCSSLGGVIANRVIDHELKNLPLTADPNDIFTTRARAKDAESANMAYSDDIGNTIHTIPVGLHSGIEGVILENLPRLMPFFGKIVGYIKAKLSSAKTTTLDVPQLLSSSPGSKEGMPVIPVFPDKTGQAAPNRTPEIPANAVSSPPLISTRQAVMDLLQLHSHEYWLYRDKELKIAYQLPSDDFIQKLPDYENHQRILDIGNQHFIKINLSDNSQLLVFPHQILLIGALNDSINELCKTILNEIGWKKYEFNDRLHHVKIPHEAHNNTTEKDTDDREGKKL